MRIKLYTYYFLCIFLLSCGQENITNESLFTVLPASQTNVTFNNKLILTEEFNPYTFKSFFNGGGVAIGDINNDNLPDIFFTGNLVENKLYLNKGNMSFEDITKKSGVSCPDVWSTGVSFVDINHDGYLDIYICKSGQPNTPIRYNQLFVNNQDLTFTDKSSEYGLDFIGLSIHAAFFDYDKDGDLDCYLLNNSIRSIGAYDIAEGLRDKHQDEGGNKLLKNLETETGVIKFVDVSENAGIYTSAIGFGLGVSIADLNGDGWDDIYVSNDFFERDYMYINAQNGKFNEVITNCIEELSTGSMGADIADLNNDGKPEIFVTEMLPEKMKRYKSKVEFESFDKSQLNYKHGYHRQFPRNVLQYNVGQVDGLPQFKELGRFHGIEATDWSWGALLADFTNNGLRDIFVANGIRRDLLDQDQIKFYSTNRIGNLLKEKESNVIKGVIEEFPSTPLNNYLFIQDSVNNFKKYSTRNIEEPGYSNGSAYADLDNDGDLDLVLNNIDATASIYRNNSKGNHYLKIKLKGNSLNTYAIGSKVNLFIGEDIMTQEVHPMRGYQSCVDYNLNFGLGEHLKVDSVQVKWFDNSYTTAQIEQVDTQLTIDYVTVERNEVLQETRKVSPLLKKVNPLFDFRHEENNFNDFDKNRIQNYFISNEGPRVAKADLDGDGNNDFLITGSIGNSCQLVTQSNGQFQPPRPVFDETKKTETNNFLLFDLNNDGYTDCLTLNGGIEFAAESSLLNDKLYVGSDKGFEANVSGFNSGFFNSQAAVLFDVNGDNQKDVIIAPRLNKRGLGIPNEMKVMIQHDNGFVRQAKPSEVFKDAEMITDMKSANLTGSEEDEIIICNNFGTIDIIRSDGNNWSRNAISDKKGIWNSIEIEDVDKDGDNDIIALNLGTNNRLNNIAKGNLFLFVNDFDGNQTVDNIYCYQLEEKYFPIHLREEMVMQMPLIKKRFLKYKEYSEASMDEMFSEEILNRSIVLEINEFRSGIFYNEKDNFVFEPFDDELQYSELKSCWVGDLNNDNHSDLILGGNQYMAQPHIGINAASFGHVLLNDGKGNFKNLTVEESGFFEKGQIRDIEDIILGEDRFLCIFKNNAEASFYQIKK